MTQRLSDARKGNGSALNRRWYMGPCPAPAFVSDAIIKIKFKEVQYDFNG